MYAVERLTRGRWKRTCEFDFNPISRLERLPEPHIRRVIDLTTGAVWTWAGAGIGYQVQEAARG